MAALGSSRSPAGSRNAKEGKMPDAVNWDAGDLEEVLQDLDGIRVACSGATDELRRLLEDIYIADDERVAIEIHTD